MAISDPPAPRLQSASALSVALNLPNTITWSRLLLSGLLFVWIDWGWFTAAAILFALAASTDWLDGYFARKYGLVTTLGRILDPLVDKVIVCGTFIFLVAVPAAGVAAWMVVLIVGRELLVTGLRSLIEQRGTDFSANMIGKVKMVLQSVAATVCLAVLALPTNAAGLPALEGMSPAVVLWTRDVILWSALLATVLSGAVYVRAALQQWKD